VSVCVLFDSILLATNGETHKLGFGVWCDRFERYLTLGETHKLGFRVWCDRFERYLTLVLVKERKVLHTKELCFASVRYIAVFARP
jgi:hypothetical protein